MPRSPSIEFLQRAKDERRIAIEDFRDAFGVTHEAAALRFTNLATEHLGITLHFLRATGGGAIERAYENDSLPLPVGVTGSMEGGNRVPGVERQASVRAGNAHHRVPPIHRHARRDVL